MRKVVYTLVALMSVVIVISIFNRDPISTQIPIEPEIKNNELFGKVDNFNETQNYPSNTSDNPSNNHNETKQQIIIGKTPLKEILFNGRIYPNRIYKTMLTPNDPNYNQWWVTPNSMTDVWDIPAGVYQTTVAVIDTGFALNHEEFSGRLATNNGEVGSTTEENPSDLNCTDRSLAIDKSCNNVDDDFDQVVDNEVGSTTEENPSDLNCTDRSLAIDKSCNNVDDDSNGFIDDVTGWDFVNYDSSPQAGEINPSGVGITHGTMVAGVLGATGNNGVGTAGVNWHTKILPIQALDDNSYGDSFTVGQSIYYAVDMGADIISISLGTSFDDPYMRTAILYALDNGAIIVASSGNSGCNCISYPANYPEVIAVGATNTIGAPASFSSYGSQLDILAPGQSMSTPTYTVANPTSSYASSVSGTSFATPFVSGLIAYGKMTQPTANWEEIIGVMFENSDRKTNTFSSPRSDTLGYGVVKANTMINRLLTPQSFTSRVQFDDLNLGSKRNYQCSEGQIPASKIYELKKSGQHRYTSNLRELSKNMQLGWTSKHIGYACMGLESDIIDSIRVLNLPLEINNIFVKN